MIIAARRCATLRLSAAEVAAADSEGGRAERAASARSGCGNVSASGQNGRHRKVLPVRAATPVRPRRRRRVYRTVATRLIVPRTSSSSTRRAGCVRSPARVIPPSSTMPRARRAKRFSASSRESQPVSDPSKPSSAIVTACRRAALSAKSSSAASSSPASSESVTPRVSVRSRRASAPPRWRGASMMARGRRSPRYRRGWAEDSTRTRARIFTGVLSFGEDVHYAAKPSRNRSQPCSSCLNKYRKSRAPYAAEPRIASRRTPSSAAASGLRH